MADDGVGLEDSRGPAGTGSGVRGVGLAATRERLAVLYGTAAALSLESGATGGAVARLPLPAETAAEPPR